MALISKASLLMVPSTYEPGTLFNVLPSGNRAPDSTNQNSGYDQTRADFTFDRGSNAAATRIGSDGLIKKYRENLLTESNNFSDSDWDEQNATLTSGQVDKDGGTDAWKLEATTTGQTYIQQYISIIANKPTAFSIYAKSGNVNFLKFIFACSGSNSIVTFDLSDGSTSNDLRNISVNAEDVGGGWYRCSASAAPGTNITAVRFEVRSDKANADADDGSFIYIQNAQAESGLVATDYLDSTSVTGKAGVLVDLPRINYDANGENGSLLLEPSRQQLFQFSEYFGDSSWTKSSGVVITDNASISPEGLKNAYRIQIPSASGNSLMAQLVAHTSGVKMTISAYMKSNTGNDESFQLFGDYGTATGKSGTLTATSEWKRFTFTFTPTATGDRNAGLINVANTAADILVYGFQAESNATYASSYIPNHSGTGGVTRAADSLYADNIGQTTAYTIFLDYEDLEQADSNFQDYISFQASGSNQNGLRAEGVGSDWRLYGYGISGSVTFPIAGSVSKKKKAIVVSTAGIKLFEDGALTNQDLSGMTIPALGAITTKRGTSAPYPVEIKNSFKQIAVFNEALSDAECISLTS